MGVSTIFSARKPRADLAAGITRDDQFMADLLRVRNRNSAAFFATSYPTHGKKGPPEAVCLCRRDNAHDVSSLIRPGTKYGGGATQGLIALVHAVLGAPAVLNLSDFVAAFILPSGIANITAIDGEKAAFADGVTLQPGLLVRSLWRETAYHSAGDEGYQRVPPNDEGPFAPSAETTAPKIPQLMPLDLERSERAGED